jgi:hypothetical protein
MVEVRYLLILNQTNLTQIKVLKWTRKFSLKTDTAMMPTATTTTTTTITIADNSKERQLLADVKFDLILPCPNDAVTLLECTFCEQGNESAGFIKCGECLDQLWNY